MSDYNTINPSDYYHTLPEGYSAVEYIVSTATQFIDTKVPPTSSTRVIIDATITSGTNGYDYYSLIHAADGNGISFGLCYDRTTAEFVHYYGSSIQRITDGNFASIDERITYCLDKNKFIVNGEERFEHDTEEFDCNANLHLFCQYNDMYASPAVYSYIYLYSCQIYDNDLLIRNFIPAVSDTGEAGLWETVNGEFYTNGNVNNDTGNDSFITGSVLYTTRDYSALPVGWSALSYIESTGTQYIDTGFVPNQDTRVEMKLLCRVSSGTTNWAFGARTSSSSNRFTFAGSTNGYYSSSYATNAGNIDKSYNTVDVFVLDKNRNITYINGKEVSNVTYTSFSAPCNLTLFAVNTNGSVSKGKIRIYHCKIYDNGTLVRDYVPVVNKDGTYGLYDLLNKKFYTNAGTGTFVAGEIIFTKEPYVHPVLEKIKTGSSRRRELMMKTEDGLAAGTVYDFPYTGEVQSIELPKGRYFLQCWGAQGGSVTGTYAVTGSKGGYSEGVITLTETTTFYIFVGGQGTSYTSSASQTSITSINGGWNGGGAGVRTTIYNSGGIEGRSFPRGGGGGTDIALVTSTMDYSSHRTKRNSDSLLSRIIVAGGGAGASAYVKVEDDYELLQSGLVNGSKFSIGSGSSVFKLFNGSTGQVDNPYYQATVTWYGEFEDGSEMSEVGLDESFTSPLGASYGVLTSEGFPDYIVDLYHYVGITRTNDVSNKSMQGGGTSGRGQYPGKATSASTGGAFGLGANQTAQSYRFCSGGGGGGWYGGGCGYSDSTPNYINYTGGGSGFVNTAANASSRPSGYAGIELESGQTIAGNNSFESPAGGTETGHNGNGYARITTL